MCIRHKPLPRNRSLLAFVFSLFIAAAFCSAKEKSSGSTTGASGSAPIGKTVTFNAAGGGSDVPNYLTVGRGYEVTARSCSNALPYTHFVIENAGSKGIRIKSVSSGFYLEQVGEELRATGKDPNSPNCLWEWLESDGMAQLRNVGSSVYIASSGGGKVKVQGKGRGSFFGVSPPSESKDNALSWRLIPPDPRYPTEEDIIAVCSVTDKRFDLPAKPATTDCTPAFLSAINFAAMAGGGTVFVPAGEYRLDSPISIPRGVLLQGVWCAPSDPDYRNKLGTVIRLENDQINPDDGMIRCTGGHIKNFTFWHSKQKPSSGIKPYPWIIKAGSEVTIHNITMLNAYRGIFMGTTSNVDVKNIYGSAYDLGMYLGPNYAAPRQRNHQFSSEYLGLSGLETSSTEIQAHLKATYATGTAIQAERVHGTEYVFGHRIGFRRFFKDNNKDIAGLEGGVFRNCQIGFHYDVDVEEKTKVAIIEGSRFENCQVAIRVDAKTSVLLRDTTIIGSSVADVESQKNPTNVTIENSKVGQNKMKLAGGKVQISEKTTPKSSDEKHSEDVSTEEESEATEESSEDTMLIENPIVRNPLKQTMFNVRDPKFAGGAVGNGIKDDSDAIQATLDAASANGGGYVFFPGGAYLIKKNIVAGKGVQLRGSSGGRDRVTSPSTGSVFYIDTPLPQGDEVQAQASITLGDDSGIRGMAFFYPNQTAGWTSGPFKKYPYTIHGIGERNYVMYTSPINPYRFIHFQGDDCLFAYSFGAGIRQLVFSNGTRNGRVEQLMTKPTNWPKSDFPFPGDFHWDQYKTNVTLEGFELFHLKDSDDFHISHGGYNHGGFRGLTAENSGGDFGIVTLEQFLTGVEIRSGDKDIIIRDKGGSVDRYGPAGENTEHVGMKLCKDFTGHVESIGGVFSRYFEWFLWVESGSLHRINTRISGDDTVSSIRVDEKGSAFLENMTMAGAIAVQNKGSLKMKNCNLYSINHPNEVQYAADNNIRSAFVASGLEYRPIEDFGLIVDQTGLKQVPTLMEKDPRPSKIKFLTTTTTGKYDFKVQTPEFLNNSPRGVSFTIAGEIKDATLQLWYYGTGGWTSLKPNAVEGTSYGMKFKIRDAAFGKQKSGEKYPDLRLEVVSGESPRLSVANLSTELYGTHAPKSPAGLKVKEGGNLDWDDNSEKTVSYNVYRRPTSSGAFGPPIAKGLKTSSYLDRSGQMGATYWYAVTALDASGRESCISEEAKLGDGPGIKPVVKPTKPPKLMTIRSKDGKELEIKDPRIDGDQLYLIRTSDGKLFKIPLANLDPASVEEVKALIAQ